MAELNRAAGTDGLIVALVGPGGVGKTSLALHWAHRSLDRFPDGQLYANLRGFSPAGEHLPASTVLRDFLEALGVEPSAIPPGGDARAALYRSLIAGRRMLVVLDDVRDAAEVTPLLPGSLTCTVVLTSRHRLAGLAVAYGTSVVSLDVLSPGEARTLLSRRIGAARVETEARTVTSLLEYCGGLPLALGVLASRATAHPEFPLSMLAEELEEESDRLDALDAGDAGVRAVFASSYRALSPIAARAFGLLGCAPGPSIGLPAIAALLGLPIPRARTVVRMLEAAHLVQQHAPARYRMHDLVRLYAMEVAGRDVPADAREAALRRLVGFYLRGAYAAGRLLYPHRVDIEPAACGDGVVPPPMGTAGQALAWCDTEYVGVLAAFRLAAAHTWDDAAWRLAWALDAYCLRRAHLADLVEIWTVATRAVDRLGEPLPRAAARWRLGLSRAIFGERDGVLGLLRTAVALFARAGAAGCQAQVHQSIGLVMSRWKEHEPALHHARRALAMSRTLGNVNGEANALNSMAWCLSQLRRYDLALPHAERALWLFRGGDDPDGEAAALDSMGYIVHQMGRYREAIGYYTSAIRKRRMIGNVGQEPDSLVRIGDSYAALGESCHARAAWRRALALYRRQHRVSEAEQVQARFDGARPPWRPPRPSARHGPSRAAPPASC
ncbi:ATP-binding protein [Nonomuraea salmonea]|uniref:ATP-binding protein n=1 Tax=Nonomuraea salmonea TaxID=46181 RepID=UPI0036114EF4